MEPWNNNHEQKKSTTARGNMRLSYAQNERQIRAECAQEEVIMNKKILERMLQNAGDIQYYTNMLEDEDMLFEVYRLDGKTHYVFLCFTKENGFVGEMEIPKKIGRFILKGRKLRSGLATPMARFYGYRALSR